jgi:hypothetical protein
MDEFYKDKTAIVYYDPELDTLFLEYTSRVLNEEQFIKINTAVLNAFLALNTQKFVADIRRMGVISVNSQKWVVENLLPRMIKHLRGKTLYHAQFLDTSEIMSKVAAANIKNKSTTVAEGFQVEQFSDREKMVNRLKTWKE